MTAPLLLLELPPLPELELLELAPLLLLPLLLLLPAAAAAAAASCVSLLVGALLSSELHAATAVATPIDTSTVNPKASFDHIGVPSAVVFGMGPYHRWAPIERVIFRRGRSDAPRQMRAIVRAKKGMPNLRLGALRSSVLCDLQLLSRTPSRGHPRSFRPRRDRALPAGTPDSRDLPDTKDLLRLGRRPGYRAPNKH